MQAVTGWDMLGVLRVFLFLFLVPVIKTPPPHRSSSTLEPVGYLSRLEPHCLLVVRIQAMAHGQEVHRYLKLASQCPISAVAGN